MASDPVTSEQVLRRLCGETSGLLSLIQNVSCQDEWMGEDCLERGVTRGTVYCVSCAIKLAALPARAALLAAIEFEDSAALTATRVDAKEGE